MVMPLQDGEFFKLSKLDTRILIALLSGPGSAYDLARRCEKQSAMIISDGTIYPAVKRLIAKGAIELIEVNGRGKNGYKISSIGMQLLDWELDDLKKLIEEARIGRASYKAMYPSEGT